MKLGELITILKRVKKNNGNVVVNFKMFKDKTGEYKLLNNPIIGYDHYDNIMKFLFN